MARILSVPERIRLFKDLNRIHKEIYSWKMIYENAQRGEFINIEGDARAVTNNWVPMDINEAKDYYFHDMDGRDITLLRNLFAWQAYYFNHVNPYKFSKYSTRKKDLISDSLGKRIRPDAGYQVRCLESLIEVQQRKDDGKIWISSSWQYRPECYGSASYITEELLPAMTKTTEGDERLANIIKEKYWQANDLNRDEFKRELDRYIRGGELRYRHWNGGYVFAASRTWRIKNLKQLNEALKVEDRHFQIVLEQYMRWLESKVIKLPEKDEIVLKKKITEEYSSFPRSQAMELCNHLVNEDKVNHSNVYLWWGGEPNSDAYYALLTLYFEVNPEDIGTSRFDERVLRNLRTLINISEKDVLLHSYEEYEPTVWRAIFS